MSPSSGQVPRPAVPGGEDTPKVPAVWLLSPEVLAVRLASSSSREPSFLWSEVCPVPVAWGLEGLETPHSAWSPAQVTARGQ